MIKKGQVTMNQMFFLFFAFRSTCPGLFRVHGIRNFTLFLKTSYALPPSPFSCQDNQSMSTESMNNFTLLKNLQKCS